MFEAVEPPYDVRVYQSNVGPVTGNRYDDVWALRDQTDAHLVLEVDGSYVDSSREVMITGQLTGLVGEPGTGTIPAAQANGDFELAYVWDGLSPHTFTLRAFEVDDTELPTQYFGYGARALTVEAPLVTESGSPGQLSDVTIELSPVAEERVTGQIDAPADLASAESAALLSLVFADDVHALGHATLPPSSMDFDFVFPDISGAEARISVWKVGDATPTPEGLYRTGASSYAVADVALPSTGLQLQFPAPVELLEPAADAAIDEGAVFRWNGAPEPGRYSLAMQCVGTDDGQEVHVNYRTIHGRATEATLPEITDLVMAPGMVCEWSVAWEPDGVSGRSLSSSRGLTIE